MNQHVCMFANISQFANIRARVSKEAAAILAVIEISQKRLV